VPTVLSIEKRSELQIILVDRAALDPIHDAGVNEE
jgi:hypothetical protein